MRFLKFSLENTEEIRNELTKYIQENNVEAFTPIVLINMLFYLNDKLLITAKDNSTVVKPVNIFSGMTPKKELFVEQYGKTPAMTLACELIFILNELGYTEFDFTSLENLRLDAILCPADLRTKVNTFKGSFVLTSPIESLYQKCCGKTVIDGTLLIDNKFRSKQIELPAPFKVKHIEVTDFNMDTKKYESVNEYRNRPERLSRLSANRKIRDNTKKANETGILTFTDTYGVPLEIGCTVAYSRNGYNYLATVAEQTTKSVTLHVFQGGVSNAYPNELIRIN